MSHWPHLEELIKAMPWFSDRLYSFEDVESRRRGGTGGKGVVERDFDESRVQ